MLCTSIAPDKAASNGIFAKVDTRHGSNVMSTLQALANHSGFEAGLRGFFADLIRYHADKKFIRDFDTISLGAPEMTERCIKEAFAHIGDSANQKTLSTSIKRVQEMDELLHHEIAWADDRKSIYIVSKQRASQNHDETTRNKTVHGEKPMFAEYLVLAQVAVMPTTIESYGHTLGEFTHVIRSYCAQCKAGYGLCYLRACLLWTQHLHWGEGWPTPMPSTAANCSWIPGSASRGARTCTTLLPPGSRTSREKLPGSNEEAQQKLDRGTKKSMFEGTALQGMTSLAATKRSTPC